ncbi:flagellar hook protein FlgE [Endozoicomonadaceae bacterium StTr2]
MSSLYTAISGLSSASKSMDNISNNIANTRTTGYKALSSQFADMYTSGGTGGGVYVADVSQNMSQGNINYTSSKTDMAIKGDGFFVLEDASGKKVYTRAGHFEMDKDNFLVNNQGLRVQGYPADQNGNLITGAPQDLKISNSDMPAKPTSTIDLGINLDGRQKEPKVSPFDASNPSSYNSTSSTQVFDSQGNAHAVTAYYVKTADNKWDVHYQVGDKKIGDAKLEFNENGGLKSIDGDASKKKIDLTGSVPGGAANLKIAMDVSTFTQFGSSFSVNTNKQNGNPSGSYQGIEISKEGKVFAQYSNGERRLMGGVVLADFANPNGLKQNGDTTWVASRESGAALYGLPDTAGLGSTIAGAVEQSNVDQTKELVNMVVVQSTYQANAKMITTSNALTQTLLQSV